MGNLDGPLVLLNGRRNQVGESEAPRVPANAAGRAGLCPRGGQAVRGGLCGRRRAPGGGQSGGAGGGLEVSGDGEGLGLFAVRGVSGGCKLV